MTPCHPLQKSTPQHFQKPSHSHVLVPHFFGTFVPDESKLGTWTTNKAHRVESWWRSCTFCHHSYRVRDSFVRTHIEFVTVRGLIYRTHWLKSWWRSCVFCHHSYYVYDSFVRTHIGFVTVWGLVYRPHWVESWWSSCICCHHSYRVRDSFVRTHIEFVTIT